MEKLKLLFAIAALALTPVGANAYDSGPPISITKDFPIGYTTKWGKNYPDINLVMKRIECAGSFDFTLVNRGDTPISGTLKMRFHDADNDEVPYGARRTFKIYLKGRESKGFSHRLDSCALLKNFSVDWN